MKTDFAIIKLKNRQYMVHKGDRIRIEKLEGKVGAKVVIDEVLLNMKNGKVYIGIPIVKGQKVEAKIAKQYKGKKIRVFKYRAKSRYRKTKGHRQNYTEIEIVKI